MGDDLCPSIHPCDGKGDGARTASLSWPGDSRGPQHRTLASQAPAAAVGTRQMWSPEAPAS